MLKKKKIFMSTNRKQGNIIFGRIGSEHFMTKLCDAGDLVRTWHTYFNIYVPG